MSVGCRNGGSTVATIRGTRPTTVKLWALVAEPAGVVAPIGPDVAPAGTWTVKRVVSADTTPAGVPLNRATLFAGVGSKPVPMMTTVSPIPPRDGHERARHRSDRHPRCDARRCLRQHDRGDAGERHQRA